MGKTETLSFDANNIPYIDLGSAVIRLDKEDPPQWALEVARKELREVPEVTTAAFKRFNEILDDEEQFVLPRDEFYLRMFLRPAHYYPEGAIKRIRNFFSMKKKYGEACKDILPSKLKHVFCADILQLLPTRDQHGRRILILEAGKKWKPSEVSLTDMFRGIQLTVLGAMVEPLSQICGAVVILDMDGLPMGHVLHFTPVFAAMLLDYLQDCICVRLKAVHIVNNSYIFNIVFNIFKPFIREKLRKRLFFHGKDYKSLHSHIDKDFLPKKYGGTANWELPSGKLLWEFFSCYSSDFESRQLRIQEPFEFVRQLLQRRQMAGLKENIFSIFKTSANTS